MNVKSSYSMPSKSIDFDDVVMEIILFKEQVKGESVQNGRYNVFLAKLTEDSDVGACITIEYIFNTNQYDDSVFETFRWFAIVDSSLVLMNFDEHFVEKYDFRDGRIRNGWNFY